MPIAFITGITGQDGSYLTEFLLAKDYVVHGLVRRNSNTIRHRLDHLTSDPELYNKKFFLHYADLNDNTTLRRILNRVNPDELYHLAGQSHVGLSFEIPESTCESTAMSTLRLLEILRDLTRPPKLLHASSSEIFGSPIVAPQDEDTPMNPATPYGVGKAFATQMVKVYRQSHGIFACNAICYNHESPRRGESFVTRKIVKGVAAISKKQQDRLLLGNVHIKRDWGYAPEYVDAMWRMLQQPEGDDYIVATGKLHSLVDFLEACFRHVNLDWREFVSLDPRFVRPADAVNLVGNPSRALQKLNWSASTDLSRLAEIMLSAELEKT